MTEQHEDGLISQYVEKVQALAVCAGGDEDVKDEVASVVATACKNCRIVKTSDPQANLLAFVARLRLAAEITHASQGRYKQTLLYAAGSCPATI